MTAEKDVQVARKRGRGEGGEEEVIWAMPERKHSFLREVFPYTDTSSFEFLFSGCVTGRTCQDHRVFLKTYQWTLRRPKESWLNMMRVICLHCRDSHQYDLTLSLNWRSADWNTFSGWLIQLLQKDISTKWALRCLCINVQKNFNFVVTWMIESISSMEHLATFRETFQKWGQKGADRVWKIINISKFLTLWYL